MDSTKKRKRPPTFQHFPAQRAKKLKKDWVEMAKLKSQWKAQKRREGIQTKRDVVVGLGEEQVEEEKDEDEDMGSGSSDAESISQSKPTPSPPPRKHAIHPSRTHLHPKSTQQPPPSSSGPQSHPHRSKKGNGPPENQNRKTTNGRDQETATEPTKPSLRELERQAYSKESLHTFKSDPLKKRKHQHQQQQRQREQQQKGTAAKHQRQPRGQPNMKLRMNAMLERIKQSVES